MMGNNNMEKPAFPDKKAPAADMKAEAKEAGAKSSKNKIYKAPEGQLDMNALRMGGRRGPGPGGGPPFMRSMVREKPKNAKGTILKLLRYIGKSKVLIFFLIFIMILATLLNLANPAIQGRIIDCITIKEGHLYVDFDGLVLWLSVIAVVFIANSLLTLVQSLLSAKLSQWTVYNLRRDLFEKIAYLPIRYTDTHKHGDIMSRMTNDVDNVSMAISSSITSLISSVLTLFGSLIMIIKYCWRAPLMILVSMSTIPLTLYVSTMLGKLMRKYFVRRQILLGSLNGQIEEMVTGYKTVMAYGKEKMAVETFTETSDEFRRCSIRANVWGGIMGPAMNLINNLNYLLVAAFGGYFCITGYLSVGNIQSIIQYSHQFSMPINQIANQYANILTAIAGAERVFSILDSPSEPDEGKSDITVDEIKGDIEFKDIEFAYNPGEPVLKKFNLSVKQGQKIAIVGATGSGKTTIVNLLMRFYDIDSGEITLDGINIKDIPKKTLRSAIAIVLQDTVLFSDTIGANIRYGRFDATDEEVKAAAITSNADTFVSRLPEGYNTLLTESGSNISQGQRQLLSIARAVLANPKILILDEATSSVDTRTEMHIQEAMIKLMEGRTSLIIAHRLSTIRDADRIIVISNGQVVESGNHDELIAAKGEYYKLYQTQFAGFQT